MAAICSARRALIASGRRPGAASARAVSVAISSRRDAQQSSERNALVPAHLRERLERPGAARDHRGLGSQALLLAVLLLGDLDHALHCENAIKRRRRGFNTFRQIAHGFDHRRQHCFVHPHNGRDAFARDCQRALHCAAREQLGGFRAHRSFHGIPAGRKPQPELETLGVDRLQLPGPGIGAADAVASGEAGHARKRHG